MSDNSEAEIVTKPASTTAGISSCLTWEVCNWGGILVHLNSIGSRLQKQPPCTEGEAGTGNGFVGCGQSALMSDFPSAKSSFFF